MCMGHAWTQWQKPDPDWMQVELLQAIWMCINYRTDCRLSVQCDFIIASGSLRASNHGFCSVSSLQSCIVVWDLQYTLRIFVVSPQRNDRSVSISMLENGPFSGWFLVSLQRNRRVHASFLHASFRSVFAVKVETLPLRRT